MLVGRTLGFQLLTAGVTVVLARLLTPTDYGLFAIALSVQLVGQNVAELGLPAALVRMPERPSTELQQATIGFLLLVTSIAVLAVAAATFVLLPALNASSTVLTVIAITVLALPIYAARAVPMAMFDRELRFGRVAAVEAADTIGFNLFALLAAIAGLGAYSLAGGVPFGAALGAIMAWASSGTVRMPRLDPRRVKPLIGFGSRVSVLGMLHLGRDLGYVTIIGAVGGAPMAGFYGIAKRLFSFPMALAAAVTRVMLPTLSQSGAERVERTARILGQTALICGLPLALVAGAVQPLIAVVLGDEWLPTTDVVIYGSLGMLLFAGVASPINSFCLAEGRPNPPLLSVSGELLIGLGLVGILIGDLDGAGIGIAMSLGQMVAVAILLMAVVPRIRAGAATATRVALVTALAVAAAQLLPIANDPAGLLIALAVSGCVWLALAVLFVREPMFRVAGIARSLLPGAGR